MQDFLCSVACNGRTREESKVNSAMFGAEPYQFELTYPPGEGPALQRGEEEEEEEEEEERKKERKKERSALPEPVRIGTGAFVGNVFL